MYSGRAFQRLGQAGKKFKNPMAFVYNLFISIR